MTDGEKTLIAMFKNQDRVSQMTDGELIDACLSATDDLNISSDLSCLVDEITTRFQKAIGLDETPNGITYNGEPTWPEEIK